MRTWSTSVLLFLAISVASLSAADSVRIEVSGGVPRLTIDGRPVRPRIFWGGPGSRPLRITSQWQQIAFEFEAMHDEPQRGTMHLRFGQLPGDIFLDDIRVAIADAASDNATSRSPDVIPLCDFEQGMQDFDERWTYWPQGNANTIGTVNVEAGTGHGGTSGLRVRIQAPADGNWPDFHLFHQPRLALQKGTKYRVTLWARSDVPRDLTIAFYRPGSPFLQLGGPPDVLARQVKLAATGGVNLISFPVHLPWPEPGQQVEWDVVDQQCAMVLAANPNALLIPRIWVGAPQWWCRAHPNSVMRWDDQQQHALDACVESPEYLHDASERLKELVVHLEEKFGPHLAGYHPTGQNTGEWFYHDTWNTGLNGYSAATRDAWRTWLRAKYGSDDKLRAAWRTPQAAIDQSEVPSAADRRAAPNGLLRDPRTEQPLIDFAEYQQHQMADCVCRFAKTVREASRGKRLVLMFYGYVHEFGAIPNGPSVSGHYALRRALDCPDIDVLCSPISYFDRALGESGPAMTAAESVALAGKMWLVEDDTYTHLGTGTFPGWNVGAKNLDETKKLLMRNTAQCAVRNFATWWMDLGSSGWFDDPEIWEVMRELSAMDQDFIDHPQPYRPEVAVVVDEASMLRVAAGGHTVTRPCVYEVRGPLGRMGAPYGQYLLDDVIAGRVHAKMFVFTNAWSLTEEQRASLLTATGRSLCVWCYAPAATDESGPNLKNMQLLTGLKLQPIDSKDAVAIPTEAGKSRGLNQSWGVKQPVHPLWTVANASPESVLARYSDGSPAAVWRNGEHGTHLFVGAPGLTSELLRACARRAGVHLYTDRDCQVYVGGKYVVLHAAQDGPIEIHIDSAQGLTDAMTGETIVLNQGTAKLNMTKGETRVLRKI
ncbi:MAG: beta-galactosidase [Pirellulales bacterium]